MSFILKTIVILISTCSIASLPYLVGSFNAAGDSFGFYPIEYIKEIGTTLIGLFNFYVLEETTFDGIRVNIDYLLEAYQYSMSLLMIALFISFTAVLVMLYGYHFLSGRMKKAVNWLLVLLDCIPDVLLIVLFQLGVIYLYQTTGFKLFQLYGIGDPVYLLPIICLSLTPTILLLKMSLTIKDEESEKLYVDFAYAKGVTRSNVFLVHMLRNMLLSITNHFSLIYWIMLSSLIMIEYLFVIQGFTLILYKVNDSILLAVAILLFLLPYLLLNWLFSKLHRRLVTDEE
ncbi:ABC transporter permease subunit [Jeotgalibacillus terrae]|uniref:ABC transporter permease subunit n=1 Tax=Jeotgalibacillus terrae TaxID=587735 RepID=A0ABW5ZLH9_9BACL|nr:ABC transporter permease subunit [Jeotgalibacillus terrae]MBM7578056.1 ABC-type dipeptide/oligopeptide/nickel transport system permease component [Jeotgalibacillus terrae]